MIYAAVRNVPAVICPCCVRPSAGPLWGAYSYRWLAHLERLSGLLAGRRVTLPMRGPGIVLIARPCSVDRRVAPSPRRNSLARAIGYFGKFGH